MVVLWAALAGLMFVFGGVGTAMTHETHSFNQGVRAFVLAWLFFTIAVIAIGLCAAAL